MMKHWAINLAFFLLASTAFSQVKPATASRAIQVWKVADLQKMMDTISQPVVINFWATFCVPCVEEIPYFQTLTKKYEKQGVKLMLVSLDFSENYPAKILSFARARKFTAPIFYLAETNADIFCPVVDSSWSGSLPASVFMNKKTGYKKFYEEQLPPAVVEKEIQLMLKPKN